MGTKDRYDEFGRDLKEMVHEKHFEELIIAGFLGNDVEDLSADLCYSAGRGIRRV